MVGNAPMNRDSGGYEGKRYIRGRRHKIRTVLFMSMLSAIQCHPKLKPMYQRLVAEESRFSYLYEKAADYPEYDDERRHPLG